MKRHLPALLIAATLVTSGCATPNPKDPLEGFNRAMFSFNDAVDQAAVKPAAEVYRTLPSFVQTAVGNFFGNLGDVWTAVNNLLQGKLADGMSDVMRVAVNSTLGFGGLLDIGSEAGLIKHKEDFGQTLGKWGVHSGPYVVLPVLGPSTLRDSLATPVDIIADPWHHKRPVHWRNVGSAFRAVDQRAAVLDAYTLVEEAALDRYTFVRDAYMQRRESKVNDGEFSRAAYEDDVPPTVEDDEIAPPRQEAAEHAAKKLQEPEAKPLVKMEQDSEAGAKKHFAVKENN